MKSRGSAIRLFVVVSSVTLVIVVCATSVLRAPGPPSEIIEPQTGMVLHAIEPGTFDMGSPADESGRAVDETRHVVTLTRRLYMGRDEVTQTEWAQVMGDNPSRFAGCGQCPVENVNFYEVAAFITNLNAASRSVHYRLPTEAEWEYACRAGSRAATREGQRQVGPGTSSTTPRADDAGTETQAPASSRTSEVGRLPVNGWGLRGLRGNVWEWVNDWYGPYDPGVRLDPAGPAGGVARVIRGGGWDTDAARARCASRASRPPQDGHANLGFRVVGEVIDRQLQGFDHYLNR